MDIFLGSVITLATFVVMSLLIRRETKLDNDIAVRYSQSHIHELIRPFIPDNGDMQKIIVTQASKHYDKVNIRVVFAQQKAYWIQDNTFYVADVVDGEVDQSTAQQVDTMSMDKLQLNKMIFIIEKLTEGTTNDYWGTG